MIFRHIGGGRPLARTPENEQAEADRVVIAHLLWNAYKTLEHLPERITGEVAKLFAPK